VTGLVVDHARRARRVQPTLGVQLRQLILTIREALKIIES
jgi:hypothetical protein